MDDLEQFIVQKYEEKADMIAPNSLEEIK